MRLNQSKRRKLRWRCLRIRKKNGLGAKKGIGTPPLPEKSGGRLEKGLANLWSRKKITKKPTLVVGQNPNGKRRIRCDPGVSYFPGRFCDSRYTPENGDIIGCPK
jgi:hypothetical protein